MDLKTSTTAESQVSAISIHDPESNDRLPLWKAIRQYPKIIGWIFAIISSILYIGYDTVIVGTVAALPWFQRDFGDSILEETDKHLLPATWVALWASLGPVGAVIAGIFAGWFQDRFGRKWSLSLGSMTGIVAILVMYVSNQPADVTARRGVFLLSKLLQGSSVGIILSTSQAYVSEIVPVSLRGSAMALFPTFILLGQLSGALVIFGMGRVKSPQSYLISFASQWPFVIVSLICSMLMPESPAWLLRKERIDDARKVFRKLYSSEAEAASNMDRLSKSVAVDKQKADETSYFHCFKGIDRRRTIIIILASFVTNFFGLPLLANASYFMQQVGMDATTSLLFLVIGIVLGLLANGVGVWIMSRVGRRPLTNITMSITIVIWLAIGIAGIWNGPVTIWYTAFSLMAVIVVCGVGCWPASYAIAVETSSLRLRARSQSISVLSSQLGNIVLQLVLPYLYNRDAADLKAKTGFIYAGICAIGTVLCWFVIPEMKSRSIAEIDEMFELRLPARAFKSYRSSVGSSSSL